MRSVFPKPFLLNVIQILSLKVSAKHPFFLHMLFLWDTCLGRRHKTKSRFGQSLSISFAWEMLSLPRYQCCWCFASRLLVWLSCRLGQQFPCKHKSYHLYVCGSNASHQMGNQKQKEQKINMNINKGRAETKHLAVADLEGLLCMHVQTDFSTRVKTPSVSISMQRCKSFLMGIAFSFQCKTLHSRCIAFSFFPAKHKSFTSDANCSLGKQMLMTCARAKPTGWCSELHKLASEQLHPAPRQTNVSCTAEAWRRWCTESKELEESSLVPSSLFSKINHTCLDIETPLVTRTLHTQVVLKCHLNLRYQLLNAENALITGLVSIGRVYPRE